jgi:pyruvate/2-oxoglutarate dehydrogenase complex dihydrolipoamide dehydrogenase (E3) component
VKDTLEPSNPQSKRIDTMVMGEFSQETDVAIIGGGLTKMILNPENGQVLGLGIVGREAGELISEGVLAIEMGAVAEDIALSIHPHPTLSEGEEEAAEAFLGSATHILGR